MKQANVFNKIMSVVLAMVMVVSMLPMSVFATQTETEETPTEGYLLTIYNADGTAGMELNGTKSASDFSLKSAIEDARVYVDNAILFGLTTPCTYVVEMYEDSTEDESFEIGADVTINGNGFDIVCAEGVEVTVADGAKVDAEIVKTEPAVLTLSDFVDAVIAANGNYDGEGATFVITPASGDARTETVEGLPNRLQKYSNPEVYYAQYQRFSELTDVSISNVNFVFVPAAVTVVDAWNTAGATTTADNINGELQLMNAGSVTLTGCTFDKMSVSPISATSVIVSDCEFSGLDAYAIKDIKASTVSVTGSTFTDCSGAFWMSTAPATLTVTDNDFVNVGRRGAIQFSANGDYTDTTMVVTGNTVTGGAFLWQLNPTVTYEQVSAILDTTKNEYETAYVGGSTEPAAPAYVAKIGETGYATLAEALADAASGATITLLADVTEDIAGFENVTLTTEVAGGVTVTTTNTGWVNLNNVTIDAGVTVKAPRIFSKTGENTILGTLEVGSGEAGTYYHGYGAKTTIRDGGKVIVNGTTILRYNEDAQAGIYVYGDSDASTVEYDCAYYIGAYSGTFYAENATVECGYFLLKNSYDGATYADINLTLDNSTLTVVGTSDTQDSFIIDDQAHMTLKNGAAIADVRDFNILADTNLTLNVDSSSSISATYMNIAEGVPFEAVANSNGTYGVAVKTAVPTSTLTNCYTSDSGYWGECGGNASESFVFKFYHNDTYMGYTSLNNVGGIIDGDVYVSWSIKLDAESNTDEYWDMAWDLQPTLNMQPTRVEHWVDGVKAGEAAVEHNWSDRIFPVVAAVTDENGKILGYVNGTEGHTLADAVANGGNITLLADVKLSDTLIIDTDEVTIDGDGHKITLASSFANTNAWGAAIMVGNSNYVDADVANHKVTIKNVAFDGITGNGLIRAQGVELVMDGCTVQNCDSTNTDQGMLRIDATEATIQNCTFTGNKATKIVGHNHNTSGSKIGMAIDNCAFTGNTISGPGVVVLSSDAGCAIKDSEFVSNDVTCSNGATVYMGFTENNVVTGNLFKDNTVTGNASSNRIAGALFVGYTNEISGNSFVGNTATNAAGTAANSVCVDTYYGEEINLSENYWGGGEPDAVAIGGNVDAYVYDSYYTALNADGTIDETSKVVIATAVATVNGVEYTDLQEAIVAAAPSGTVELLSDVTVDKWVMITESLSIGTDQLITIESINGLTIDGNGYTLTVNGIESAKNGDSLFFDATELNIRDLTIKYADGVSGGIGLTSGTISNVTFVGGAVGVYPGTGDITITGCTFETNGTAIYYEGARDDLVVTGNTFELPDDKNVIIMYGEEEFTNNTVVSGRTVNVAGGSPVVTGNDFGNVRLKVYNDATATIENNTINNLVFNDESAQQSTFTNNTLSEKAQEALDAVTPKVAKIGDVEYDTLEEAVAAAQAGDEIVLIDDATLSAALTLPAGIILNGGGFTINGTVTAGGDLTFKGHTKVTNFNAGYSKPTITIGEGACLELTGTGRMVIGHGATFNITGTIADAKTANTAELTPSLIAAGASFTGAGVNFNVTNAYLKFTAYCSSKNSNASGTFDFNVTNSIWEQASNLQFSVPTNGMDPTVNFELKDSVLTTTQHVIFGVTKGEVVIDNSKVNEGVYRQLENRSTMTVKNGSVVYASVQTSQNAINPGTTIVDNATYMATGEFSGTTVGTGKLVLKNGANATVPKFGNATVELGAGCALTTGSTDVSITTEPGYEAKYENGAYTAVQAPVAQIGETKYYKLEEAFKAATSGCVIDILTDVTVDYYWDCRYTGAKFTVPVTINGNGNTLTFTNTVYDAGNHYSVFRFESDAVVNDLTIDMTNAISGFGGRFRAISAKGNLTVDNCTFIGNGSANNTRAIIFGEGGTADSLANVAISVTNSSFTGWRQAIGDNETGKTEVKSVVITGNTMTDAGVNVSAFDSITFTGNTVEGKYVKLVSYTADNALNVTATGNTLTANTDADQNYIKAGGTVEAQDEFVVHVEAVAEVNGVGYPTLQEAVDAAQAGDTVTVIANISDEAVTVDKNLTITGAVTLNNVSINANGADELTVSGLTFTGNSWINSGSAEKLTVSGVTANVTPSNAAQTNSRSAFISLGRSEQQSLELVVEDSNIVSAGGSDPILGWACITKATLTGNTFGSADAYQNNSDSVKFMSIADGAEFTITGNTVYSNYNGIVFAQNTTRGNAYTVNLDGNTFVGSADHIWLEITGGNTCNATVNATSNNTVNGNAITVSDLKAHTGVIKNWTSYVGVDVVTDADGKVIGGTLAFYAADAIAEGYEVVDGVVQKAVTYLAEVNGEKFASVIEALNYAVENSASQVLLLTDSREVMPTDIELLLKADLEIVSATGEAVVAKFYNDGTSYDFIFNSADNSNSTLTIGENVTFQLEDRVIWAGYYGNDVDVVVDGALIAYQYWHGADTTINATGTLKTTGEALVMRRGATLTVDGGKVEANYFNILAGNIFAENAEIKCGAFWIANTGSYANEGNVSINIWDSNLTSSGNLKVASTHAAGVSIDVYNSVASFEDFDGYGASELDAKTTLSVNGESAVLTVKNMNNNGTVDLYDGGTMKVTGTLTNNNALSIDATASLEATAITGAGTITIDATGMTAGNIATIAGNASEFAGTIEVINNDTLEAKVDENGNIVLVKKAVANVAEINGVGYPTLADAFAAAEDGDTITLVTDVELNEMITNSKKVTLDLNGKTVAGTDNATVSFGLITNSGDLTIKDGSAEQTGKITLTATNNRGWSAYSSVVSNNPGGKFTLESGTLEHLGGTDMAYGIDNLTNGKGTYAETVINGGTIKSTYSAIRQFLNGVEAQNILTINGGTVEGATRSIFFHDPSKNANSGTLTVSENAVLVGDVRLSVTAGSTEWPVEVSIAADALAEGSSVTSSNVPEGYEVQLTNGVYGVVELTYVAQIGDVKYADLQAAIDAAQAGDTIVLLDNLTIESDLSNAAKGYFNIAADQKVTIDLNGKTIDVTDNSNGHFILFYNYGELTMMDNVGGAKVNLTATIDRSWNAQSTIVLNRGGVLTVESGEYNHLGGTAMAITICNSGNSFGDAYLYVNGGTITSTYTAVRMRMANTTLNGNPGNGLVYMTVTGGTIKGNNRGIWGQITNAYTGELGALEITGGTIEGGTSAIKMTADESANIDVAISGDAMVKGAVEGDTADYAITGGTFDTDVTDFCAEGYTCEANGDGTYGVVAEKLFDFAQVNMRMGENLSLIFYFKQDCITDEDLSDYVAKISVDYKDERGTVSSEIAASEWMKTNEGTPYYVVEVSGLAAKEMADDVTITIYKGEKAVSMTRSMSLRQYGELVLKTSKNDEFKTTVVDMLNYGAKAQEYFEYNTSDLANNGIDDYQSLATANEAVELGMKNSLVSGTAAYLTSFNMRFVSDITMIFGVAENCAAESAKITFTNHLNKSIETVIEEFAISKDEVSGKQEKMFEFGGMVVADIDQVIRVEFFDADGNSLLALDSSINAYLTAVQANSKDEKMKELSMEFGKFATSAYAYQHEN